MLVAEKLSRKCCKMTIVLSFPSELWCGDPQFLNLAHLFSVMLTRPPQRETLLFSSLLFSSLLFSSLLFSSLLFSSLLISSLRMITLQVRNVLKYVSLSRERIRERERWRDRGNQKPRSESRKCVKKHVHLYAPQKADTARLTRGLPGSYRKRQRDTQSTFVD